MYRLTFVLPDGRAFTTEASGYFAEGMFDRQFDEIVNQGKAVVVVVVDDAGSLRRRWANPSISWENRDA